MNRNVKGLIVVLVVGVTVFLVAKKTGIIKSNKQIVLERLTKDFGKNPAHKTFIDKADKEYIDAWAKAIKKNQEKFFAQGRWHWTEGGASVKS